MITTVSGAIHAGLRCRCPRRGKGELVAGFLTLQPRCEVCDLDYGLPIPATARPYSSFLAGFIVVGAALVTEAVYHPPYWVDLIGRRSLLKSASNGWTRRNSVVLVSNRSFRELQDVNPMVTFWCIRFAVRSATVS